MLRFLSYPIAVVIGLCVLSAVAYGLLVHHITNLQ